MDVKALRVLRSGLTLGNQRCGVVDLWVGGCVRGGGAVSHIVAHSFNF